LLLRPGLLVLLEVLLLDVLPAGFEAKDLWQVGQGALAASVSSVAASFVALPAELQAGSEAKDPGLAGVEPLLLDVVLGLAGPAVEVLELGC